MSENGSSGDNERPAASGQAEQEERVGKLLDDMADEPEEDEFGAIVRPYPDSLYGEDDL